jgi:threonine dehydrogenase-like Zn-dependent dehydrogenase
VGIVGAYQGPLSFDPRVAMRRELSVIWVWSYALRGRVPEFAVALDLLARGVFRAAPLITHRYPLGRIGEGFAMADNPSAGNAIKVLVIP